MARAAQRRARRSAALASVLAIFALAVIAPGASAKGGSVPPIHVRGTVYTFDNQVPIAGATVGVAELPGVTATSGPDGTYDLVVPGGTKFTPYSDAPGHHRIYLQTWVSQGRDMGGVNFQMPTDGAFNLLSIILAAPRQNGELVNCAVVSTFSTVNVRDVPFSDFVSYGAHGVANATATASPALPKPVYFNESVIPDPSRTFSSIDGGVVWAIVPAGVYRFTAQHPTTRFAPFRATCAPGRVVNANPTQGFYELRPDEQVDTDVDARFAGSRFDLSGRRARLRLRVEAGEYAALSARLLDGKKAVSKRRTKGFAPGKRALKLPVPSRLEGERLAAEIVIEDGEGNTRTVRRKLRVPAG